MAKKYEYQISEHECIEGYLLEDLNKEGADGWELVSILPLRLEPRWNAGFCEAVVLPNLKILRLIFKRELE